MKAKKLLTLLEGEVIVLYMWLILSLEEHESYNAAKERLSSRWCLPILCHWQTSIIGYCNLMNLYQFLWLLEHALLTADANTSKQLLLHQFIGGLLSSLSK